MGTTTSCISSSDCSSHVTDIDDQHDLIYNQSQQENFNTIRTQTPQSNAESLPISHIRTVGKGQIEFDSSRLLGKGPRSFVYNGKFANMHVAVKRISCVDFKQMKEYFEDYNYCMEFEKHVNIVEIYGVFMEYKADDVYVAMEFCSGNLIEWMNGKVADMQLNFDTAPVHQVLKDITEGVAFLHRQKMIHGYLKPWNILVGQKGNEMTVKVADFGIIQAPKLPTEWDAPEIFKDKYDEYAAKIDRLDDFEMSSKSDIFSLGLIYYWIITPRRHPFGDNYVDREYNLSKYYLKLEQNHFEKYDLGNVKLLKGMLAKDPKERHSIDEIQLHPILWSNEKTFQFLSDAHDALQTSMVESNDVNGELESQLYSVNWIPILCPEVSNYLLKSMGKNHTTSITSLCRTIRNINENYHSLPDKVQKALGSQDQMLKFYWKSRFPYLIQTLWESCKPLKTLDNKYKLNGFYGE